MLLADTYGRIFIDTNGDRMPKIWADALQTISPEQAKLALERCITESPYPPHLAQFLHHAQAKTTNEHGLDYVPQHLRQRAAHIALPRPPADKQKAIAAFSAMRNAIHGRQAQPA